MNTMTSLMAALLGSLLEKQGSYRRAYPAPPNPLKNREVTGIAYNKTHRHANGLTVKVPVLATRFVPTSRYTPGVRAA